MSQSEKSTISINARHKLLYEILTDDLEASVGVNLSNVSGAEPPLAVLVHKKVIAVLGLTFVVAHRYIGPADQNLSPRVGLVSAVVTT